MILHGNCMELNYIQEYLNKTLTTLIYGNFVHIWINLIQDLQKQKCHYLNFFPLTTVPSLIFLQDLMVIFVGTKFLLPTIGISFANLPVALPDSWSVWPSDLLSGWQLQLVKWTYFVELVMGRNWNPWIHKNDRRSSCLMSNHPFSRFNKFDVLQLAYRISQHRSSLRRVKTMWKKLKVLNASGIDDCQSMSRSAVRTHSDN